MDGLFTEFPDRNVAVINRYLDSTNQAICNIDCDEFDTR